MLALSVDHIFIPNNLVTTSLVGILPHSPPSVQTRTELLTTWGGAGRRVPGLLAAPRSYASLPPMPFCWYKHNYRVVQMSLWCGD